MNAGRPEAFLYIERSLSRGTIRSRFPSLMLHNRISCRQTVELRDIPTPHIAAQPSPSLYRCRRSVYLNWSNNPKGGRYRPRDCHLLPSNSRFLAHGCIQCARALHTVWAARADSNWHGRLRVVHRPALHSAPWHTQWVHLTGRVTSGLHVSFLTPCDKTQTEQSCAEQCERVRLRR